MTNKNKLSALAFSILAVLPVASNAALTQISTPDVAYTGSTTQIDIAGLSNFANYASITDGSLTASFSSAMNKRTVPGGWGTWGSPPATESASLPVLYSAGATSVAFSFSGLLDTFGVELEPNPFSVHTFTMEFFNGATSLGSISRAANGSSGARLLAAASTLAFDRVVVSSDADWAAGRFRYDLATAIPEPASLLLFGLGLAGLGSTLRRK